MQFIHASDDKLKSYLHSQHTASANCSSGIYPSRLCCIGETVIYAQQGKEHQYRWV